MATPGSSFTPTPLGHENNLGRLFRALPLTPEHRQLWCQARSMWNITDWQKVEKVVFSDDSRFVLETDDNRVRVWRHPGERYNSPKLFYVTLPAQLV
ncbi:hypothetical protein TNCV_2739491 [Trichonephila clavipes]|nr:hypothetical protein TNCV_2739491 [Trichonephila clavipes]